MAALPRRDRAERAVRHSGRLADGGDAVARRVQSHLDAAHTADEDLAGGPGRQLRVHAARGRLRLHAGILRDDHPAAGRDAGLRRLGRNAEGGAMKTEHGVAVHVAACAKTFADGTRALEPVTLDIGRGETVVLLGPSGCGKTTMLRMIAGLEQPDPGGRILFNDIDVTPLPIEKRNIGMVFQSYALFPNMTVAENIGYGLKIRGVARKERTA